jgi:hypothetical protein
MGVEASAKAEAQNGVWTGTRRHRLLLGRPGGQAQPLRSSGEKSGNVPCVPGFSRVSPVFPG